MPDERFYPLIEGVSVRLRRHVRCGAEGREEFVFSHGEGTMDGVAFDVGGTMGCSLDITFKPKGLTDDEFDKFRYFVSVEDLIHAAYEQFKKDMACPADPG